MNKVRYKRFPAQHATVKDEVYINKFVSYINKTEQQSREQKVKP